MPSDWAIGDHRNFLAERLEVRINEQSDTIRELKSEKNLLVLERDKLLNTIVELKAAVREYQNES